MTSKKDPITVRIKRHKGVKWYNGRVGQTYNVVEAEHPGFKGQYQVDEHRSLFIEKTDCDLVKN